MTSQNLEPPPPFKEQKFEKKIQNSQKKIFLKNIIQVAK